MQHDENSYWWQRRVLDFFWGMDPLAVQLIGHFLEQGFKCIKKSALQRKPVISKYSSQIIFFEKVMT